MQNPCPTSACSLSTGLSLSKTRLPRLLCSGSPALTCFSVSLSPDQNFQLLGPGLEAASHADVYRFRQSQVNHSWPAMNWKVRIVSKSSLVFVCFGFFCLSTYDVYHNSGTPELVGSGNSSPVVEVWVVGGDRQRLVENRSR